MSQPVGSESLFKLGRFDHTVKNLARRFRPAALGKWLVHTLVIEFGPKELLERFDPPQPVQQVQNVLLPFES